MDKNEDIKEFLNACDKMASSKFIMIDKRISDILKSIAKSESVFNLVKECMINFNFDLEWKKATAKVGCLNPPEETYKFIAFVFAVLNCVDDKKISASDLLSKYFTKIDNSSGPYAEFCQSIIIKFKNAVKAMILPDEKETETQVNDAIYSGIDKDICARIIFLAKDLKDYVNGLKKIKKSILTKGEFIQIVNTFINVINDGKYQYAKALILAMKAGKGKDKEIDHRLNGIIDVVTKSFLDA